MPLVFPENGVIRLYNQFPRRYKGGLPAMIEDLPRIAALGFNVIWINPVQLTGDALKAVNPEKTKWAKGSLYAMAHDKQFNPDFFPEINGNTDKQAELLTRYVQKAKELGLIPIFDLVLNHVGRGQEKPTHLEDKFKDHLNKERKKSAGPNWSDTIALNYETDDSREYVIQHLWIPLIKTYIETYGFMGVRVDAITNVNPELQKRAYTIIRECCKRTHGTEPIIIGELMAKNPLNHVARLAPLGFSHIFACGVFYNNFFQQLPDEFHWLTPQVQELQKIIWNENRQGLGGVVAFVGNHDVATHKCFTLYHSNNIKKDDRPITFFPNDDEAIATIKAMQFEEFDYCKTIDLTEKSQERLFRIAFTGNAGWYLLAGDELEIPHRPRVFDNYKEAMPIETSPKDLQSLVSLQNIIWQINYVLSRMPKTSFGDKAIHQSIERTGKNFPVIIHESNYDHSMRIICLNLDVNLTNTDLLSKLQSDKVHANISEIFILGSNLLCFNLKTQSTTIHQSNFEKTQNNTTASTSTNNTSTASYRK